MDAQITAGHGPVEVSSGREDIRFRLPGRSVVIGWDDIVGAGLARAPSAPTSPPQEEIDSVPGGPRRIDVIPFGGRLVDRIGRLGTTHRALLVAYGRGRSFQVFLPTDDPGTQRFVEELRIRLGERWLDGTGS
jgi:hypothetical protein